VRGFPFLELEVELDFGSLVLVVGVEVVKKFLIAVSTPEQREAASLPWLMPSFPLLLFPSLPSFSVLFLFLFNLFAFPLSCFDFSVFRDICDPRKIQCRFDKAKVIRGGVNK
jgi:hypothetical protein